jgi:hypothetical protein
VEKFGRGTALRLESLSENWVEILIRRTEQILDVRSDTERAGAFGFI